MLLAAIFSHALNTLQRLYEWCPEKPESPADEHEKKAEKNLAKPG